MIKANCCIGGGDVMAIPFFYAQTADFRLRPQGLGYDYTAEFIRASELQPGKNLSSMCLLHHFKWVFRTHDVASLTLIHSMNGLPSFTFVTTSSPTLDQIGRPSRKQLQLTISPWLVISNQTLVRMRFKCLRVSTNCVVLVEIRVVDGI